MNVLQVIAFLQQYPGILALVAKLPKFDREAADLLIAFLRKIGESRDPEGSLKHYLKKALAEPVPTTVQATVVSHRPLPRQGR